MSEYIAARILLITEVSKTYEINEKEKKRSYNRRVLEVEHETFTPLVFSATGGMGREVLHSFVRNDSG